MLVNFPFVFLGLIWLWLRFDPWSFSSRNDSKYHLSQNPFPFGQGMCIDYMRKSIEAFHQTPLGYMRKSIEAFHQTPLVIWENLLWNFIRHHWVLTIPRQGLSLFIVYCLISLEEPKLSLLVGIVAIWLQMYRHVFWGNWHYFVHISASLPQGPFFQKGKCIT